MSQINCFNLESSYQYQRSKKKKKMHGISIIVSFIRSVS